jgi:hypothetical protein
MTAALHGAVPTSFGPYRSLLDMTRHDRLPILHVHFNCGVSVGLSLARGRFDRLVGWALLASPRGEGLVIPRCRSIHTFGMRFPIDVAFVTWPLEQPVVPLKVEGRLAPGRLLSIRRPARATAAVELPAGTLERLTCRR